MDKGKYLEKLSGFRKRLSKKLSISRMVLFGSRAEGTEEADSDFDLIIVSDDFKEKKSFVRAVGFYKYWDIDSPVDFICLTEKEYGELVGRPSVVGNGVRNGILIE